MIPTMILVGLLLGVLPLPRERRVAVTVAIAVVVSLAWGVLVGGLVGGTLVAFANLAVGVLVGAGLQAVGHAVFRRPAH